VIKAELSDNSADADRPQTARYAQKREQIIQTAARLFNTLGVRGATLEDIARDVGMNLTSIRHYFRRKEDLVSAAFQQSIAAHAERFERAREGDDREARVRRLVREYFDMRRSIRAGDAPEVMIFGDMRSLNEQHAAEVWPRYVDLFRTVRTVVKSPTEPGEDRMVLSARAHFVMSQLIRSVFWLPAYPAESIDRVERMFTDILFNGLVAPGQAPCDAGPDEPQDPPRNSSWEGFLLAATRLINEQGYRGASVERIAAELNRTKGAFYHHVEGKGDLVVACFNRTLGLLQDAQNHAVANHTTGLAQAYAAVSTLVRRQQTPDGPLLRNSALMSLDMAQREPMQRQVAQVITRFADMATDAQLDGSGRLCDARIAGEMLMVTVNSAAQLKGWANGSSAENAVDLYVRPMFHGLFA
jgi:AcrR family transcriptional regulator